MSRPVVVTPRLVERMALLKSEGATNRQIGQELGVSMTTVQRATNDRYANGFLRGGKTPCKPLKKEIGTSAAATACNAPEAVFADLAKKLAPVISNITGAAPEVPTVQTETPEEEIMLLPKQTLSPDARKLFSLFINPFDGEVRKQAEFFNSSETRFISEVAWQTAKTARFTAIVGESGAGKTTVLADLKWRLRRDRKPVLFIEPSVLGMEDNDTKGKTIKSADIEAAIVLSLDEDAPVARGSEKRSRQIKNLLLQSDTKGYTHLLVIEEAHALPVPTLKHLKRLYEKMSEPSDDEYKKPLLGVLLLGHPELGKKLDRHDVREVMQRCETVRLLPLGPNYNAYLQHRAECVGRKLDEFITPDGVDELRTRLTDAFLYPLNVNNWMIAALNTAAGLGAARVDRDVVRAI